MNYAIIRELKRLASLEHGHIEARPADCTIALVYPNSYFLGMSSMGFQLVYGLLNSLPEVRCERGFLLPGGRTLTVESRSSLASFDCVGFSLSCEQDYPNVIEILRRAGVPLLSRERDERHPMLLGGGVCAWLNPEPLADIFDLFVVGEAEAVLPALFRRLRARGRVARAALLRTLAEIPGVYVPALFEPRYGDGGRLIAVEAVCEAVPRPARQWVKDLDEWPARAPIVTPETEFGERAMIEAMRGCGRQCRFCVADYGYRPPRTRSAAALMRAAADAPGSPSSVAIVGPSLTDYPGFEDLCSRLVSQGMKLSVSSLRVDGVGPGVIDALARGGLRSLTVAPESPSERLQRGLNKEAPCSRVFAAAERAAAAGMRELKLYYLVGVGGETMDDIEAIAEQARTAASCIPVRVSVGPLVPKARTPLQWAGMAGEAELKKKYRILRRLVAGIGRARLSFQSIREALNEATLARGDRTLAHRLIEGRLPKVARESYALREREADEVFPWEHIDGGVDRGYLLREYRKLMAGELTPPCRPVACRACGACTAETETADTLRQDARR